MKFDQKTDMMLENLNDQIQKIDKKKSNTKIVSFDHFDHITVKHNKKNIQPVLKNYQPVFTERLDTSKTIEGVDTAAGIIYDNDT